MKINSPKNKYFDNFYLFFILPIIALAAPIILLPVEKILPYPHILEETTKAIMIFLVLLIPGKSFQIKLAVFLAFLFALSENIFYLSNSDIYALPTIFVKRFFLVSILHILTALVILIPTQKKRLLIFPAALLSMLLHYLYNQYAIIFFK